MAKRGRKPKQEQKGYFYAREEQAVVDYNNAETAEEKNTIYETILKPAFVKMIESIIRRYKLYGPEEEFLETFNDTLSFMVTKMGNFRPVIYGYWSIGNWEDDSNNLIQKIKNEELVTVMDESTYREKKENATDDDPKYIVVNMSPKNNMSDCTLQCFEKELRHFKAYSYCGTVAKNYLINKIGQYQKKLQRNTPYEEVADYVTNDIKYSDYETDDNTAGELIQTILKELKKILTSDERNDLNENELKVGDALCFLLENWEDILVEDGSNKLSKSSVLYFLREATLLTTKEIRDGMKRYKTIYKFIKQAFLE